MLFLKTVNQLLEHIKEVEQQTMELTNKSQMSITSFIEKNGLQLDDETVEAMQYQDIISQQLSATIEAIENVQKGLLHFEHAFKEDEAIAVESLEKMNIKLNSALRQAKEKHTAFSGKIGQANDSGDDGIEFF